MMTKIRSKRRFSKVINAIRSHCIPLYFINIYVVLFLERSTNDSCPVTNVTCDCPNEKKNVITPDLKEALFAKEFQDQILNTVFSKNDNERNNNNRPRPPPVTPRPNVVTNKATPFSQGCDYNSKVRKRKLSLSFHLPLLFAFTRLYAWFV